MKSLIGLVGRLMEQGMLGSRFMMRLAGEVSSMAACRYMMYIHCEDEIYMLDRDNSVFLVPQLKFFSRKRKDDHIFETLVDGVSCIMLKITAGA